jgi:hypothetical protein
VVCKLTAGNVGRALARHFSCFPDKNAVFGLKNEGVKNFFLLATFTIVV